MADVTIRDPKTGKILIHTNDETCVTEISEELLNKKKQIQEELEQELKETLEDDSDED